MAKKNAKDKKSPRVSVRVVGESEAKKSKEKKASLSQKTSAKQAQKSTKTVAKKTSQQRQARRPLNFVGLIFKPFTMFARYVAASWRELRQVHWPNRGMNWQYTLAVIFFSLFFGGLIFGFDALFTYLFKEIII